MKVLFLLVGILLLFYSCCGSINFRARINRYENAVSLLKKNEKALFEYQEKFLPPKNHYLFFGGRNEIEQVFASQKNNDLESISSLWKDGLIWDGKYSVRIRENGDIYFLLSKCPIGADYLIYNKNGKMEVDASDDNIKERVGPNWIYLRSR